MNWRDEVRQSFANTGVSPDEDVVLELAQHADAAYESGRADGLSQDEARARVRHLVDGWCRAAPVARRRHRAIAPPAPPASSSGLAGLWLDVVYGIRLMRRQPGAAAITVLTIALAIAATTTLASVAYGVLARPLPWPDADRLVRVQETREGATRSRPIMTNVAYHSWLAAANTIDGLAGYSATTATIDTGDGPERVRAALATATLFDLLGATPVRGRLFTADDERADDVALISHGLWQRRFGTAEDVVGRLMDVAGDRHTIIGVLPAGFGFPDRDTQVWTPMLVDPLKLVDGHQLSLGMFSGLGRLAPGATADAAALEATTATRNGPPVGMVATAVFGSQGEPEIRVVPLAEAMTGDVRPALLVLLSGVALLFTTAVGGIATMQVARAMSRRREVAIRAAIGAGAGRLARQLLLEHLAVGLAGGAAGLVLAAALHASLPGLLPADFPRIDDIVLDWRIALLAATLAVGASIATAAFPLMQARRLSLVSSLSEDGRAPLGARLRSPVARLRAAAMVAQVAMTVVLLVGAMLIGRSFVALTAFDRGYDPVNLLTATLPMSGTVAPTSTFRQTFDEVAARLRALPGVRDAAYAGSAPFLPGGALLGMQLAAGPDSEPRSAKANLWVVSPGFIETLGLRVLEGRALAASDSASAEPVAMVNRSFAREYLGERPLDEFLPLGFLEGRGEPAPDRNQWRIVGVLDDVAAADVAEPTPPQIIVSTSQLGGGFGVSDARFVVRTDGDPQQVVPAFRSIARELAGSAPLDSIMTMEDRISASLSRPRLYTLLLGGFSGFALLVAGVGLFAVLSHGVAARRRELGVRLALGATPRGLLGLVLRDGLTLTVVGVVFGVGIAAMASRSLDALLFGVSASDPASYVTGAAVIAAISVLACAAPAVRAARVDPVTVLRL